MNDGKLDYSTFMTSGWVKPILEEEKELSVEELYGFPESELTVSRTFMFEYGKRWPEFCNPIEANYSKIDTTFLKDNVGDCLFAPGLIHWLYGPSETGKSFLALTACLEVAGVYVSIEMGPRQVGNQVRKMAFHPLDSNRFLFPEMTENFKGALLALVDIPPTVIVIDSFGELALYEKADTNNDQDVGRVIQKFIKPLASAGHCVIVIDHIAKNPGNTEYPLGTQNKKSQSDICLYINRSADSGLLELIVTKDRYYVYEGRFSSADRKYGVVEITDSPVRAKIHRVGHEEFLPIKGSTPKERMAQDAVMAKLIGNGALQKKHLTTKVTGVGKTMLDRVITHLIDGGWIDQTMGKNAEGSRCRFLSHTGKEWTFAPR